MGMRHLTIAILVAGLTTGATAKADPGRVSQYSDLSACQIAETKLDEAGYVRSSCVGPSSFKYEIVESDGRQNLVLDNGQAKTSLALPSLMGGGFSSLGSRIEWRGDEGADFQPDALILRYNVVEDANVPDKPTSYLLVAWLKRDGACLAGKAAPGADQNELARKIADGELACSPQ